VREPSCFRKESIHYCLVSHKDAKETNGLGGLRRSVFA
jgi:hypothetical protein